MLFAAALSAGAGGCAGACGGSDALVVRRVLVDVSPAAVAGDIEREAVREVVQRVLARTRGVRVDDRTSSGAVLRVSVDSFARGELPPAHPHTPQVQAALAATLSLGVDVSDSGGGGAGLRGHSVSSATGVLDPLVLVEQAFKEALQQVLTTRAADRLDSAELLAWLTTDGTAVEQQRRAMRVLASRRDRAVTPVLVGLLDKGHPELAEAALQALAILGDPAAIPAIVAFSANKPSLTRKLCVDAVKATASPRALPWLFTLHTGHPDPDVQAHAAAALAALETQLALADASGVPPAAGPRNAELLPSGAASEGTAPTAN